jgi:hypothetical protein
MRFYGELKKVEEQDDGSICIYGVASTGARDDAGEIVTPDAMKAALPGYLAFGAIREMHQPSAAGTALSCFVDENGDTCLAAHIVDPLAVTKVKTGVYKGLSIGGKVLQRDPKDPTTITAIKLLEISLVDRPCNPEASINMWKMDAVDDPPPVQKSVDEIIADVKDALARAFATVAEIKKDRRDAESEALLKAWPTNQPVTLDTLIKIVAERAEFKEQLDKLLAEPMPPKAAASGFVMVEKVQDAQGPDAAAEPKVDDIAKAIAAMSREDRAHLLMKAALSNPISITR